MESPYPSLPDRVWDLPFLSAGVSGIVLQLSDSAVVKVPCGEPNRTAVQTERAIYKRLGSHPCITKLLYAHRDMLVLERLQYPLRKRLQDLHAAGRFPLHEDVLRWALQLAQALHHVHLSGVLQVDIGTYNALLDWDDNVKLCDFAGSSIDGSIPTVFPSIHSQHPNIPAKAPSVQSELFALGSMLYEVETMRKPYHDQPDSDITRLYAAGEFPDTSALLLGGVVTRCWRSEYKDVAQAIEDVSLVQDEIRSFSESSLGGNRGAQTQGG
ncbi:kinase-like protein [Trematosphaeria pertusa]|uniref:Kinase-like protein n=1 Tax=Trematosphaeria pertusa TaxID=390896 RepID=A0A6A6I3X1_9PLEO|nr:kinase-like protein [Trematosphaeria pertusa]KAF2244976.1 kinase-like protein [Trematosphaeria pertusa]